MQFIDLNDDRVYSLQDLHRDWAQFRQEDPEKHAPDFKTELFEILMATINGRNDLEILHDAPGNQQPDPSPAGTAFELSWTAGTQTR